MPAIHPTATVDAAAHLADDVVIGPGCLIDGPVRLGAGTRLLGHVVLNGPVTIGAGNTLYPFTCVGYAPQDRKYDPATPGAGVAIGDHNVLRESVTIHRATGDQPTRLGDRNYLMVNSHLGHDAVVANDCTLANGALVGGHATIDDRVLVGGNAAVHQFVRVGRLAVLSGLAGLSQDLPPFCTSYYTRTVGSLNIVGLRRAGYRRHIPALKRAFELLFQSRLSNASAIARIENELGDDPLCAELAAFVRASKRGVTAYVGRRAAETEPAADPVIAAQTRNVGS